jgi:hypothetical protein
LPSALFTCTHGISRRCGSVAMNDTSFEMCQCMPLNSSGFSRIVPMPVCKIRRVADSLLAGSLS